MSFDLDVVSVALNPAVDWTLWVPGFRPGVVNRVQREQTDAGGKGVNVASFLADAGLRVAITGFRGAENADIFRSFLGGKGVADRFVDLPGKTRLGIKIVDPGGGSTTEINFAGLIPSGADLARLESTLDALAGRCEWFVLTGRVPPGVSAGFYADLIARLKAAGRRTALDTSGEALRLGAAAAPDLIKPNLEELSELAGRPLHSQEEILEVAQALLASGIRIVVVSMGERGALFARPGEAVFAAPPRVPVTSTTGAGDALLAGTIAGLLRGLPISKIARFATACAAGALTQVTHTLPAPAVLDELARQVAVTERRGR